MPDTRSFEMTLDIAVPADAVWQALTDAEELVRWFPTEASITPGAGGRWLISWDGHWPWHTDIEIWEPARRLRLVDRASRPFDVEGKAPKDTVAPLPLAIDWYLDAHGATTTLRLVHAGFGRGADWDDEYEGVQLGWLLELNGLKHYLERHRGRDRQVVWSRTVVAAAPAAVWPRLAGRDGVLRGAALRQGDAYAATLATGDRLSGQVMAVVPDRAVQLTVRDWNDALFRIWIDRVGGDSAVNAWLSAYDVEAGVVRAFDARLRLEIDRLAAAALA